MSERGSDARWSWLACVLVTTACAAEGAPEASVPIALADAWTVVPADVDPYWNPSAPFRPCAHTEYGVEGAEAPYLEVRTQVCNYLTVQQPSLVEVRAGDTVTLSLSHQNLEGDGAEGLAAVMLGRDEIWSQVVPVSAAAESHNVQWTAPLDIPEGTTMLFHIANHGANAWRLQRLDRLSAPP